MILINIKENCHSQFMKTAFVPRGYLLHSSVCGCTRYILRFSLDILITHTCTRTEISNWLASEEEFLQPH